VDAYRLGDEAELDDLDIDAYVEDSVTVVEWGEGVAEGLATDRLRVHLARRHGGADDEDTGDDTREIFVTPVGARWVGAGVRTAMAGSRRDSA
jgi:tRNA threonylcarbamoyladenosine biosynthesis protein TsaE